MQLAKVKLILAMIAGITVFSSCNKSIEDVPGVVTTTPDPVPAATDKIKDSALLYARDIYLWYNQIPVSFDPQTYGDPNKILEAVRAYSQEPGFSAPVDRWSFAMKQNDWDNVSSGITQDFGLNVFFKASDDLRVKLVEKESPAGRAGIRRGWRIVKVGGNTNITTSNTDYLIPRIFESNSTSFTFQKPDGTTTDITLNSATYQEHPVILDTVYTTNSEKVGYLVFNSFLGDTIEIYNNFQRIFNRFSSQNIKELVVDLRYNGGGYVTVQEKLANYLVNASGNGNIMMTQKYNDKYTQYNTTSRYRKLGSLNLTKLFFIVSNNTASASELLINNLKPYMEVKLVGPSNTYGKPVGFFPIPAGDWYVFPVSFRTINKNGEGSYFSGIPLDNKVADGLDKDWGDASEACLASALRYITTGGYMPTTMESTARYQADPLIEKSNIRFEEPSFKGAIAPQRLRQ